MFSENTAHLIRDALQEVEKELQEDSLARSKNYTARDQVHLRAKQRLRNDLFLLHRVERSGPRRALFPRAEKEVFTAGLHNRDYAAVLCSLLSPRFKDYAKEDTSVLLSYCNTLLDVSLSSACRDFPSAAGSLFCFLP